MKVAFIVFFADRADRVGQSRAKLLKDKTPNFCLPVRFFVGLHAKDRRTM